ncbi:TolB family protein [Gemmatimonadota bacterium]
MTNKMNRREFLPLAGAGAVLGPTLLSSCSDPTSPEPVFIPGTIAFERRPLYSSDETQRNIYIMDWSAETQINLTADIPGSQGRPFWSPDGTALYFDSIVDGKGFIQRINDLTDPVGSLETIVNEAGHQSHPMVYSDNNLLIYNQTTDLDINAYGAVVAFDLNSGQEISRCDATGKKVLDNNRSSDRAYIYGERKVLCTKMSNMGTHGIGVFEADTGALEAFVFDDDPGDIDIHSVAVTSDGLSAYGITFAGSFGVFDMIVRWGIQPGERDVYRLNSIRQDIAKARANADIIELPNSNILLSMFRPGYISSSTKPWKIGHTDLGTSSSLAAEVDNTAAFPNMTGSNYWPRHTFTEHL